MIPATKSARIAATPTRAFLRADAEPVDWWIEEGPVRYEDALAAMDARVDAIRRGAARELVWLLEHPPLYTAGTSTGGDLPHVAFPVYRSGRGGQLTYHGPGQRVVYVLLDLQKRRPDVRAFVAALESWIIATLATFDIHAERRDDRVGVWVERPEKPPSLDGASAEDKIAAIGIRIRGWVSFHGISLNVAPDLSHYDGITPCGIADRHFGVTSFSDLARPVAMSDVDAQLRRAFVPVFGPVDTTSIHRGLGRPESA